MHSLSVCLLQTAEEIPLFGEKPTGKQIRGQVQTLREFYGLEKSSRVVRSPVPSL